MTGIFIAFEGGEGTGKSTQVNILRERLEQHNYVVVSTREPGGTLEAELLRGLLVSGEVDRWNANEELLLNFAARSTHVRKIIGPALAANKIVLCDRFVGSTWVYQCVAGGASVELLQCVAKAVLTNTPDITFVLDIDPSEGILRSRNRMASMKILSEEYADVANETSSEEIANIAGNLSKAASEDRYERKGIDFHKNVRKGFQELSGLLGPSCHIIDASPEPDVVADQIWRIVANAIELHQRKLGNHG